MIWARDRPRTAFWVNFLEIHEVPPFYQFRADNGWKVRKKWFWMDFVISGRIAPLRSLWICFVFQWFGELLGARACAGVGFPFFMKISRNFIKFMKCMKIHEISRKFIKLMKIMETLDFCDSGRPETLIFLRKYWCFCNIMESMKYHFFTQNCKVP